MVNEVEESSTHSLSDYLKFCEKDCFNEFWIGGYLLPFDLPKGQYRWVLFPVDLCPGLYRLCLMLASEWTIRPIQAIGMIFPPGEHVPLKKGFGYEFSITPAIATGNSFHSYRNTTVFRTRYSGVHQLGVATPYWSDDVERTCFELMLMRIKETQLINNTRPEK